MSGFNEHRFFTRPLPYTPTLAIETKRLDDMKDKIRLYDKNLYYRSSHEENHDMVIRTQHETEDEEAEDMEDVV